MIQKSPFQKILNCEFWHPWLTGLDGDPCPSGLDGDPCPSGLNGDP